MTSLPCPCSPLAAEEAALAGELALELFDPPPQLVVPLLGELDRAAVRLDALPATGGVVGGDRVFELAGARLVEELGRQPCRLRVVLEQRVEEARAGAVLVVAVELAWPGLVQRAVEDRVAGGRADERVVDPAVRLQRGGEEVVVVDHVLERPVALEIGVHVDAPRAEEHLEPEDVGALSRHPQALVDLGAAQVAREVVLGPEAVLPVRVVAQPRLAVAGEVVREGLITEPDLMEDPGYHSHRVWDLPDDRR